MASDSHLNHPPVKHYVFNLVVLTILMLATIGAAQIHIPTPGNPESPLMNNVVALFIATIKAGLVVAVFMGVRYTTTLVKMWAYTGFTWFTLMFIMWCDYGTRNWEPVAGWEGNPANALPREPYRPEKKAAGEHGESHGATEAH
ncbi:MAG TPA: hypothetical protein PLH94_01210 [Fimbriimonadaceae bacterium]|nr:hypothetical protein [Fimbriimonadaceae bacterium]